MLFNVGKSVLFLSKVFQSLGPNNFMQLALMSTYYIISGIFDFSHKTKLAQSMLER